MHDRRCTGTSMARRRALALALAAIVPAAFADDEASPAYDVAALVRRLGDDDFFVREAATRKLWEAGPEAAREALERARDAGDPEIAMRARRVLWNFDHGILVDTPAEVVALIEKFRTGSTAARLAAFNALAQRGELATMRRLFAMVPEEAQRRPLATGASSAFKSQLPEMLAHGRHDAVLAWLELLADVTAGNPSAEFDRDRDAFLWLTARLAGRIAELHEAPVGEAEAAKSRHAELARLLILEGDLAAAEQHAVAAEDVLLRREVAFRRGDWAALASDELLPGETEEERLAGRAAFLRLAGRQEEFERAVANLLEKGAGADGSRATVEALLICEQWEAAEKLLQNESDSSWRFDLLCTLERQEEAFERAGLPRDGSGAEAWCPKDLGAETVDAAGEFRLTLRVAREVRRVRGPGEARELFEAIHASLIPVPEAVRSRTVVARLGALFETEVALDLENLAIEQAAAATEMLDANATGFVLDPLFECDPTTARIWWQARRNRVASESPEDALRWTHELLVRRRGLSAPEFAAMAREVAAAEKPDDDNDRRLHAWAAADAAHAREDWDLAAELTNAVDTTPDGQVLFRAGALAWERERWDEAAELFDRSVQDADSPATRIRAAWAHRLAGHDVMAARRIELARLLWLGDSERRWIAADELAEINRPAEARREWETVLRLGRQSALDGSSVTTTFARLASALDEAEPLRAADLWERFRLSLLARRASYDEASRYLAIAHLLHRTRARGLIAEQRFDEALAEAERAHEAWPGNIELALELVPPLEAAGRAEDADRLFARVHEVAARRLERFPDSSTSHNDLAWLLARLDRRLDDALRHAERAVVLEPENAAYLDTLAEVHFRRGDRERAIELARRCIELDPLGEHYREQLARFQRRP